MLSNEFYLLAFCTSYGCKKLKNYYKNKVYLQKSKLKKKNYNLKKTVQIAIILYPLILHIFKVILNTLSLPIQVLITQLLYHIINK